MEDEQSFVLSERPGLRKFLAKACPRFVMPSRRTVTRNCVKVFDAHKEKLKILSRKTVKELASQLTHGHLTPIKIICV